MSGNTKSKGDIASSLSRMTGIGFENALMKVNGFGSPRVVNNITGSMDIKAFRDISRSAGASDNSIIKETMNLTGRGYENILIEMSSYKINKY